MVLTFLKGRNEDRGAELGGRGSLVFLKTGKKALELWNMQCSHETRILFLGLTLASSVTVKLHNLSVPPLRKVSDTVNKGQ